jgi:hypothetical protein
MAVDPRKVLDLFEEAEHIRRPYEQDWRDLAAHALPRDYREWIAGPSMMTNSGSMQDARRVAFDSTAARALSMFVAICERLATPRTQKWHMLQPSLPELRRQRAVKEYFDQANRVLWDERYKPAAAFSTAQSNAYQSLGLYGNGPKFITKRRKTAIVPKPGLHYIPVRMSSMYVLQDEDFEVNYFFRLLKLNARQAARKFGFDNLPVRVRAELAKEGNRSEQTLFEFVHAVMPADDYDPEALDRRRLPWMGCYVAKTEKESVGEPVGYLSRPYVFARTFTSAEEPYGVSPGMQAYPSIMTASQIKKTMLKQGQKAVEPSYLAYDDGIISGPVDMRPNKITYGGLNAQGEELIKPVKVGDFRVAEVLLQDERKDIISAFYADLFEKLMEDPNLTATQVVNIVADRAAILSPLMGKLQSEDAGPTIERELVVLQELGLLPEMPPELVEAQGEYTIEFTSPAAKAERAEEVAGFQRTVEFAMGVAQATGDSRPLRRFNFDAAIPEIAETQAVPQRWMKSDEQLDAEEEAEQGQQETQQLIDTAPALASVASTAMKLGAQTPKPAR